MMGQTQNMGILEPGILPDKSNLGTLEPWEVLKYQSKEVIKVEQVILQSKEVITLIFHSNLKIGSEQQWPDRYFKKTNN